MLFLENLIRALLIFNGLRSHHGQRALLGYHYHLNDLLCDLRRLSDVGILQEQRTPTPQETLPAPVALLAFQGRAMSHNIHTFR